MTCKEPHTAARRWRHPVDGSAAIPGGADSASAALVAAGAASPEIAGRTQQAPVRPTLSRKFKLLLAALVGMLLAATALLMLEGRHGAQLDQAQEALNTIRLLTQRIDASALRAANGEPEGFDRMALARDQFGAALGTLLEAGRGAGMRSALDPMRLRALSEAWIELERPLALLAAERVRLIELRNAAPAARAAQSTTAALSTLDPIDPGHAAVQLLRQIGAASERVLAAGSALSARGTRATDTGTRFTLAATACGGLAFICLLLMGKLGLEDAEGRARASQEEALRNDQANRRTQVAILRLLDEMEHLAQGDLTVRASVSEEVTGAIADSVNFAVDELRRVVEDINRAAVEVAAASSQAQAITGELLNAAQRQAQEIAETNTAAAIVAKAIVQVSTRAADSARVADLSLAAAAQGGSAVRRAIQGMDGIREQIQDTAKRIKRLGESSQEIGEIVDLIADITEQTNVLALNAAIQATSAGPAGRGFTIVAEEVQRLAERSAQATRQISAIVRTIQADTQDATSAMERSIQGVVEQTGLADATCHALARIEEVSRRLATLIGAISAATREQSESADRIREYMMDIQRITALTTEGTRKTADATARLARLAQELKQSVAGFKLS